MTNNLSMSYFIIFGEADKSILKKYSSQISKIMDKDYDFCLLTEYKEPPLYSVRYDGYVTICIVKKSLVDEKKISLSNLVQNKIYHIVYDYFNKCQNFNYKIIQLGKPLPNNLATTNLLDNAEIILPHKGKLTLLNRCIKHLSNTKAVDIPTKIIFDSFGYKSFIKSELCRNNISVFKNVPLGVGPYLGRHHSILRSNSKYFYFQDSDDISVSDRFSVQMSYLKNNKLDMVGCHELRIDQFSRTIKLVRFPIDVSKALIKEPSHPLFHPTSLIKKTKYIESGGFSLNRKFSSDTQFLLRAHFTMKIGNVDDFLYIRFNRPNSLTTNSVSNLNTNIRKELDTLWKTDFDKIKKGELQLNHSSLKFEIYNGNYKLIEVNYR